MRGLLQKRFKDITSTYAYVRAKVALAVLRVYLKRNYRGDWERLLNDYISEVDSNMNVLQTFIRCQVRNDDKEGLDDFIFEVWQELMNDSRNKVLIARSYEQTF